MGKLIQLQKHRKVDPETLLLVEVADSIDTIILHAIKNQNLNPRELAGVLAHRLGTLIRQQEGRDLLFKACTDVAAGQALIEKSTS